MTGDDGRDAWCEHTTPVERVRTVAGTLQKPRPATHVAEHAGVPPSKTQTLLDRLTREGILTKHRETSTAVYAPNLDYTREKAVRELHEHSREDLERMRCDMQATLNTTSDGDHATELVEYRLSLVEAAIDTHPDGDE